MQFFTKLYDTAIEEPATQLQEATQSDVLDIAAAMAKHGVKNDSAEMVATPIEIKKEPKAESETKQEPKPVDTTTSAVKVEEEAKAEPAITETKEVQKPTEVVAEQPKIPTWQEAIKSQQPNEVLKELGFDEKVLSLYNDLKENPKMLGLINHWKEKGEITDYLREASTDYSKMDAKDVMRHQLRQEYPKASEKQLDILFKKEVINAYNLDEENNTEDEVAEGQLLLEAKADRYRDTLIKNQEKYFTEKYVAKEPEKDNTEELRQQDIETVKKQVTDNPLIKELVNSKKLVIGEGDDKFTYELDTPSALVDVLTNDTAWAEGLYNKTEVNGKESFTPNVQKQLLLAAVHNDPEGFIRKLIQHGKSLGGSSAINTLDNAKPIDTNTAAKVEAEPKTPAEAMARGGRINSGS